ncbi:MAG: PHP domain-containing protein [Lactobacillales bacterium]|jgi:histidinol-phosphatase (PHP family)|nr:PHP domain-containing protein [Lactobacillales bacterium]
MNIKDWHVHTDFSFDSTEPLENYLALAEAVGEDLVFTDHLEFSNPYSGIDDLPDWQAFCERVDKINSAGKSPHVYKGIEIGWNPADGERIREWLSGKSIDVKLLSVHNNGEYDYMDDVARGLKASDIVDDYFNNMSIAIEEFPDVDILTHFEYGVRLIDVDLEEFKQLAEAHLRRIFAQLTTHDIALEINAKSAFAYGNYELVKYGVALYKEVGGTKLTLGSDAHRVSEYRRQFDELEKLL